LLARLPALALGLDPAFRLRPSFDPDFLRWIAAFLRNCTSGAFDRNTIAGLQLALESQAAMGELLARHPLDFDHKVPGKLHLFEDEPGFAAARETLAMKRKAGAVQEALTPAEAIAVEPALENRSHPLVGAIHSPEEESGDPFLFCRSLLQTLREHYGLRTCFGRTVRRLDLGEPKPQVAMEDGARIRADAIVVCAGVDAPRLLRGTGVDVPICPMKGYSLTAPLGPEAPRVSITDVKRKVVFCRLSGRMRIAGLADLGARDAAVQPERLASLIAASRDSLPDAAQYDQIESSWAGLRPMTPNSLPIIRSAGRGLILNVGHGALGWTYAMGAAERASNLLVNHPC
jgi:D-amino-acid dehydrogenase